MTNDNKSIEKQIEKCWKDYIQTKDSKSKEELIVYYSHIIKYVAGRMGIHTSNLVDTDDLISYGIFGLIDAIEKFDIDKGVKFETYASLRIRGAIIDGLRSLDWVPRALRQKSKTMEHTFDALTTQLGREPENSEIAQQMGINESEVETEIKRSSVMSLISFDEYLNQNHEGAFLDSDTDEDLPESQYSKKELKEILVKALDSLTKREREVVSLYYFNELTLKEIAKALEVTESRISQIHSKALLKLKAKLGKFKSILFTG